MWNNLFVMHVTISNTITVGVRTLRTLGISGAKYAKTYQLALDVDNELTRYRLYDASLQDNELHNLWLQFGAVMLFWTHPRNGGAMMMKRL